MNDARLNRLAPDAEADLIRRAQQGDEDAKSALLKAYEGLLWRAVTRFANRFHYDHEDVYQDAVVVFLELVASHDVERSPILAPRLKRAFYSGLADRASATKYPGIPQRMVSRYLAIMDEAENDIVLAAAIAREHDMALDTFLAIHRFVNTASLDAPNERSFQYAGHHTEGDPDDEAPVAHTNARLVGQAEGEDAYDSMLTSWQVRALLDDLDDESREIVRIAYGFEPAVIDGEEVEELPSDRSIAAYDDATVAAAMTWRHGVTYSRQKVQRRRTAALRLMRERLEEAMEAERNG